MEIRELYLGHFGKFHQKAISLKPGINIIYGPNEAGKSTVHSFIRGMLLGIGKKRGREAKDDLYTKYQPWETPGAYQGSMELSIGSRRLLLVRNFLTKERSLSVTDLDSGREFSSPETTLEALLHFNASTYRGTISVEQLKSQTEKGFAGELQNYIANLTTARSNDIDIAGALQILKEKKRSLLTADPEPLLQAQDALISELSEKCTRYASLDAEFSALQKEQQRLHELVENAKSSIPDTSKLESAIQTLSQLQEQRDSARHIQEEQSLRTKKEQQAYSKRRRVLAVLPVLAGFAVFLIMALSSNHAGTLISAAVLVPGTVWYFLTLRRLEEEQEILQAQKPAKNSVARELLRRQQEILEEYHAASPGELVQMLSELLLDGRRQELAAAEYFRQYGLAAQQAERIRWTLDELGDVQMQYEDAVKKRQELAELVEENKSDLAAVDLAADTLRGLSAEIHDSFGRELNRDISKKVASITGGAYSDVTMDEQLVVKVRSGQEYFPLDRLSIGTNHQIYLAVRLAVAELFFPGEAMPLILDDAFALYDDNRLAKTLSYLHTYSSSSKKQILVFTCHKRDQEVIEQLGIPYSMIEL